MPFDDEDTYADEPLRSRRRKPKGGLGVGGILLIVGGVLAFVCLIGIGISITLAYWGITVAANAVDEIRKDLNAGLVPPGNGKVILSRQGRLMPNDPVKDGMNHKSFTIRLEKGKTYVIDLESNDMDSFLRLYDPRGIMVANDDDGGGFLNSRIRHLANETGNYEISASVFAAAPPPGGAGFVLTVREENE